MRFNIFYRLIFPLVFIALTKFDYATSVGSKTYELNNGFPTNFLNAIVDSDIVKQKLSSRWRWQVWDVVPGTHAYKLYVFNITNPDEVEKGEKPNVQQVGPYYYKEYRYKFDVSMNLDMSVNYQRNFSYTFDPSRSEGLETDTINAINIPLVTFATLAEKYSKDQSAVNRAVSDLVASGESIILKNVQVGNLLYNGIDVSKYKKYVGLMGPSTLLTEEFQSGQFSVLKLKNGAHEGQFTVDSGLKNVESVGQILSYNGRENLTYWNGDECNKIRGSDGSTFPPDLKTSDEVYMFEVDLCRSVSFDYSKDVQYKGITGHVYFISEDVLDDPSSNKENECFCPEKKSCLKKGALDVSACQFGAPYVMSFAHFYDADSEYQQGVSGLQPNEEVHRTQVILEPVTGAVITFDKRYQWNIWVKPLSGIDYFKKFRSTLVPILWNDDVFTLDSDKEELLIEELARQAGGMGSGCSNCKINVLSWIAIVTAIFSAWNGNS